MEKKRGGNSSGADKRCGDIWPVMQVGVDGCFGNIAL